MRLKIDNIKQQKRLFIIIGFSILCIIIIILVVLYNRNNEVNNNVENMSKKEERILREKNVSGITQYTFSDDSLQYTTQVAYRDIEGNQKECIVVELESVDVWSQIDKERQIEIVEGLINTSRLQIDKEFGCVVLENLGLVLIEGFWQDVGGYVIIEK